MEIATTTKEQSLILLNKREVLLTKLDSFKEGNLNAKDKEYFDLLADRTSRLFIQLCWAKLGVSLEQLKKLERDELGELAGIIYERSITHGLIQNIILACIPIVGWIALVITASAEEMPKYNYGAWAYYQSMRYSRWYKKIKKISGKNFCPNLTINENM